MSKTSKSPPTAETRLPTSPPLPPADRFSRTSVVIGMVARDPIIFRSVVDAFEAGDGKLFQHLLAELRVGDACETICAWLRSKECVLECLEVCGPPPQQPVTVEQVARFAQVVTNLGHDEFLTRRLVDSVQDRDSVAFKAVVSELGAEQFCHLLCHWVCVVRYRLICEVVCGGGEVQTDQVVAELARAGAAVGELAKKNVSLRTAIAAAVASDADSLSGIIGGFVDCYLICEWFCSWRCMWICLPFCQSLPIPELKDWVEEMREFALFSTRLAENKDAFPRLLGALQSGDSKSFAALVSEFKAERYCLQFCHWFCYETCSRLCFRICPPPPPPPPWFTNVGLFNIYSDIDPLTGLTNKAIKSPELAYGGGPYFAFYDSLQLSGNCPNTSPVFLGEQMCYRFLYAVGSGTPVPIKDPSLLSNVYNNLMIDWPVDDAGFAKYPVENQPVLQAVIGTTPSSLPPAVAPPASGAPYYGPSQVYITPDTDGWITVPMNAEGNQFTALLGFDTTGVVTGGMPPGMLASLAGASVPPPPAEGGTDLSIIFQATRVSTKAAVNGGAAPDYTNTLTKIHINNWNEVNELNFAEFATGCCTPINDSLHVLFTVDHEQMGAGQWSLTMASCSGSAPPNITPYTTTTLLPAPAPGINATQTSIAVVSNPGFPSTPFTVFLPSTGEIMWVTNASGTTLTVIRGQEGTSASPATAGATLWTLSCPPLTYRGGSGTILENTSAWGTCSYLVWLTTRPGLTTGNADRSPYPNLLTFCICGH